jgi:hypothetical protein
MSDYLSNLVNRSFTPAGAIQPRGAVSYEGQAIKNPAADIFDPFAALVTEEKESAVETPTTPSRQEVKHAPRVPQLDASPYVKSMEAVVEAEPKFDAPAPPERKDSRPHHEERVVVADRTTTDEVRPPKPEAAREVVPRIEKAAKPKKTIVSRTSQQPPLEPRSETSLPAAQQKISEQPKPEREVAGSPQKVAQQKKINSALVPAPAEPGHTTRQLLKPAVKPVSISAQAVPEHLQSPTGPEYLPREEPREVDQPPTVSVEIDRQTRAAQDRVFPALTTLVPKLSAPLPSTNARKRSNAPLGITSDQATSQTSVPETVINVAIGRIEVRATPAVSGRSERTRNGPKIMKLDDYLQQRSRGNR